MNYWVSENRNSHVILFNWLGLLLLIYIGRPFYGLFWAATELIFSGVFSELGPEQIVALCSCLVFEERVLVQAFVLSCISSPFATLDLNVHVIVVSMCSHLV